MAWLIVFVSINGTPPRAVEKIPFDDMQSCQAEKAARDSRQAFFASHAFARHVTVERKVVCSVDPAERVG
jgi:hypothetical protein